MVPRNRAEEGTLPDHTYNILAHCRIIHTYLPQVDSGALPYHLQTSYIILELA